MKEYNDLNISRKIKVNEFEFYRIEKFNELKIRLNWTYKNVGIPSVIVGVVFCLYTYETIKIDSLFIGFLVISIIPSVIYYIYYKYNFDLAFENRYKNEILTKLIPLIDQNIQYCPDKKITDFEISESHLFDNGYAFIVEDYFEGKINEYSFKSTDLQITSSRNSKVVNSSSENHLVFYGMFFSVNFDFAKDLEIEVLPNKEDSMVVGEKIIRNLLLKSNENIKFENEDFNDSFLIHSNNASLCQALFTNDFQTFLTDLNYECNSEISFSLRNGKLYFALNRKLDSFEIDLDKNISVENMINQHYRDFKLFFDTIEKIVIEMDTKKNLIAAYCNGDGLVE